MAFISEEELTTRSYSYPPVTGEQIYRQVCKACHMADAKGATGAATIPALADNPHLSDASYPITMVCITVATANVCLLAILIAAEVSLLKCFAKCVPRCAPKCRFFRSGAIRVHLAQLFFN
jgi:hypothetical protein